VRSYKAKPQKKDVIRFARWTLITTEHPAPNVNISVEMCLLRFEEFEKCWRLELIDLADASDFSALLELHETLDMARRSKCLFMLTVWKSRDSMLNRLVCNQGSCYRFKKVHSLKLLYGNPVGSMQIRDHRVAEPLGDGANLGRLATAVRATHVGTEQPLQDTVPNVSVADTEIDLAQGGGRHTPPQKPRTRCGDVGATPAAKSAAKRKSRKEEGTEATTKQRKRNPAPLCTEQPMVTRST
jgi:uncharacterized ferredoxin-like protein